MEKAEAAELIRSMIERIVLTPNESRRELIIDLRGDLAGILRVGAGQSVGQPLRLDAKAEEEMDQVRLLASPARTLSASYSIAREEIQRGDWRREPAPPLKI